MFPTLLAFGFGNVAMLAWLAAIGVPLAIHLWSRRRHHEVPWAAVEFLLAAIRQQSRRIQLRQWLLLAVRMLLVALAVTALAEPYWEGAGLGAAATSAPTHHVLILDASYSMGYRAGDASRFNQARDLAGRLAGDSRPADRFSILLMGDQAEIVAARPPVDRRRATELIDNLQITQGGGNLHQTLEFAQTLIRQTSQDQPFLAHHAVTIFTDLGRTSWHAAVASDGRAEEPDVDPATHTLLAGLASDARVTIVDLGRRETTNIAITRLEMLEPFVVINREVVLQASLANFDNEDAASTTVQLLIDEVAVAEQDAQIPAGELTTANFSHRFDSAGSHVVRAQIGGDSLEVDDTRWLVVPVRDRIQVLCVAGETDAAKNVAAALNPTAAENSMIRPLVIPDGRLADFDLRQFDAIFLCNVGELTHGEIRLLARFQGQGGGIVWFLGDQAITEHYNTKLAAAATEHGLFPVQIGPLVNEPRYRLDPRGYKHPIVAPFTGREQAGLLTTQVYRYFELKLPEDASETSVALALDNGDPLIVTGSGAGGRSVVVATDASLASLDPGTKLPWTTMPAWPSFLPLVREMLNFALGDRVPATDHYVGTQLTGNLDPGTAVRNIRIQRPDGQTDAVHATDDPNHPTWRYSQTDLSGIYTITGLSDDALQIAVNLNTRESHLQQIDPSRLPKGCTVTTNGLNAESPAVAGTYFEREGFHRWLLYAVLGLILSESYLACRFGRESA